MAKAKKTGKGAQTKKAGAKKAATKKVAKKMSANGKKAQAPEAKANGKAEEAKAQANGKAVNGKTAEAKKAPNGKQFNGKAAEAKKAPNGEVAKQQPKVTHLPAGASAQAGANLDALRKPVDEAKANLDKAKAEAKALTDKAQALVKDAKDSYRETLAPYRDACRKAGVDCEFEGGRSANVSEKISFLVEKTDKGVRVMVRGRPDTEETIPLDVVKQSINKAAYHFCDKHVGPREKVGNKGGSLSNRLRAVVSGK